jgi:hypothetical protein
MHVACRAAAAGSPFCGGRAPPPSRWRGAVSHLPPDCPGCIALCKPPDAAVNRRRVSARPRARSSDPRPAAPRRVMGATSSSLCCWKTGRAEVARGGGGRSQAPHAPIHVTCAGIPTPGAQARPRLAVRSSRGERAGVGPFGAARPARRRRKPRRAGVALVCSALSAGGRERLARGWTDALGGTALVAWRGRRGSSDGRHGRGQTMRAPLGGGS